MYRRKIAVLVMLTVILLGIAPAALAQRTVIHNFYSYTYDQGTPADNKTGTCTCTVGPCPPYETLVGQKTYCCGTLIDSWGYDTSDCRVWEGNITTGDPCC
jgi:hypothetical protein